MNVMNIGERLKQARLNTQMTQDQLGEALGGLTGPTISALEKGIAESWFKNRESNICSR
jgi:transcriptional regulator with XRE-family HTH domain